MESIRKWLYKPKRDDKSLLAQFFYADEDLNEVANELDSFDGRKDPERCTYLVNQLRHAQDKVLTITNAIMDVLIGEERANRDFRCKFPEDVLQENLAGQLWFGAECLAAGSSIMNREAESTSMRPLAKAVTKSLENVRNLLRDVCLRNNTPNGPIKLDSNELITEMLLESLKIFDRLFAEFELAYVSAMVPVKTTEEYELQELIGVLFSETLQRALKMKLLTQDLVDDCDPALMFTIPRLAIVSGLMVFPNGPLCVDKPVDDMSEMFRPFRTLLRKIRELLWTLDKRELYMLEKLLCDNEQIGIVKKVTFDDNLDEFIKQFYEISPKTYTYEPKVETVKSVQKENLCAIHRNNNIEIPSTSSTLLPPNVHKIIALNSNAGSRHGSPSEDSLEVISIAAATLTSILAENNIDFDSANDSGISTETASLDRSPSFELTTKICSCPGNSQSMRCNCTGFLVRKKKIKKEDSSESDSSEASLSGEEEEIALAVQAAEIAARNEVRSKYRSSEDLLHRLFVCIAGVADQLQTNFACDLRNILKSVFLMNATDTTTTTTTTNEHAKSLETASLDASIEYHPSADDVIETNEFSVDPNILAQEALFDTNVYFHLDDCPSDYTNHPRGERNLNTLSDLTRYATLQEVNPFNSPPVWIPDIEAPKCMSCGANFTVVKRRHHCRNCGKVFCARCSSNSVPLPKFGHVKPVRVCNRCFIYNLAPFTV